MQEARSGESMQDQSYPKTSWNVSFPSCPAAGISAVRSQLIAVTNCLPHLLFLGHITARMKDFLVYRIAKSRTVVPHAYTGKREYMSQDTARNLGVDLIALLKKKERSSVETPRSS